MSKYLGDFALGQTVRGMFSTGAADGSRVDFSNALEVADIRVYKNGSATERSSTAGFTVTSGFDSMVGIHYFAIDTADNTDTGFYVAGADFTVVLYPDETVDSKAVAAVLATFSIENRFPFMRTAPALSTSAIPNLGIKARGTLQSCGATSAVLPASSALKNNIANGDVLVIEESTDNFISRSILSTTLSTDTVTYDTMDPAPTGSRPFWILTGSPVSASQKFPATIAAGDIATDALSATAASAAFVSKVQSDLATASALAVVAGYLDTEIAAIKAKTDNLPASPAAEGAQMALTSVAQLALVKALFRAANGAGGFGIAKDVPNNRIILSFPDEADENVTAAFDSNSPAVTSLGS